MKLSRSQMKAKLEEAAQELIETLLDWDETNKTPSLREIEDEVLVLRQQFGQILAATVVEGQEAQQPALTPCCPKCGEALRYKGRKSKKVESRVGTLHISRGRYCCPRCESGVFPLDRQLGLSRKGWSEGVEREVVWLSGAVSSFQLVKEILERVGQIQISQPSVWRTAQIAGNKFQKLENKEREKANCLPEKWDPPSRAQVTDQRMGVSMDGAMVHIRKEGWKEVKIGDAFDIAVRPTKDEKTGEMINLAHAENNRYVAHLGGPDILGELLWAEARRCGWEQAQDTMVCGDGAVWIWNQADLHFGQSRQLVDWYHAKEHLTGAARLLNPEGTASFSRWLNSRETLLFQGHATKIADELTKAADQFPSQHDALAREAAYFQNNHLRMNYLEMREEEWPIGSGMIESGAKQFKARFCGPGMQWSRTGAENLLPIRAAVLSHRFNHMWDAARSLPPI